MIRTEQCHPGVFQTWLHEHHKKQEPKNITRSIDELPVQRNIPPLIEVGRVPEVVVDPQGTVDREGHAEDSKTIVAQVVRECHVGECNGAVALLLRPQGPLDVDEVHEEFLPHGADIIEYLLRDKRAGRDEVLGLRVDEVYIGIYAPHPEEADPYKTVFLLNDLVEVAGPDRRDLGALRNKRAVLHHQFFKVGWDLRVLVREVHPRRP